MPEGDSVFRLAARMRPVILNKIAERVELRVPAFALNDLSGRTVTDVVTAGKNLGIVFGDQILLTHLMMDGIWQISPLGERWIRPSFKARAIILTKADQLIGFDLGKTEILSEKEFTLFKAALGPDPLAANWNRTEAIQRISSQPEVAIGIALLDQTKIAGLGNIYRNEACFLAGVHPSLPVGQVDVKQIVEISHTLINLNRERPRRTRPIKLDGPKYWVYGRKNASCLRCRKDRIIKGEIAAKNDQEDRIIFWCPTCQREQHSLASA